MAQACLARDDARILALLLPPWLQLPQPQPQQPRPECGAGVDGGEVQVEEEGALLLQLCVRHGAAACALLVCTRLRLCEHVPEAARRTLPPPASHHSPRISALLTCRSPRHAALATAPPPAYHPPSQLCASTGAAAAAARGTGA